MNATTSPTVAPVEEAAPAPPVKGKGRLLVVVALGLLVLTGGGAGAWWLFLRVPKGDAAAHEATKTEEAARVTVPLGPVVVNLTGEARRYLRVGVSLGVANAKEAKEVEERKPQLLDLLISALSSTEVDVLTSEEGRADLKETLLERIRAELALPRVARIYFTEFMIQ